MNQYPKLGSLIQPVIDDLVRQAHLVQYKLVRIKQLKYDVEHYNSWRVNTRAPSIGDVGTIVEILEKDGYPNSYVVESSGTDGITIWLGDFLAEEIEVIG